MHNRFLTAPAVLLAALAAFAASAPAWGREENVWPAWVAQKDAATDKTKSWQSVGPFIYKQPSIDQLTVSGFRPIYLQRKNAADVVIESSVLYPFFVYRRYEGYYSWSIFNLINRTGNIGKGPRASRPEDKQGTFDIWPFYFSRHTGSPESSYKGLLPIGGEIKNRLGYDRLSWVIFPLYGKTEKRGVSDTFTPWPFIRTTKGAGTTGFAFWPLFGHREHPGEFENKYYLWPLIYKNTTQLSEPQPVVKRGFLPFYAKESGPFVNSATYGWPFFGWTDVSGPRAAFHEKHYFWPFFVQARGEQRNINRWAPFYSHSIIKGTDKHWVLWPVYRHATWNADKLDQTQDQFLFFVYWSLKQQSPTNPNLAPAYKKHLWPLFSAWDNGAGLHQVQVLSPFEVFFPHNDTVRESWTPLFAIYRYNKTAPDKVSNSLLWNAVTWKRDEEKKEFHLGPIFSVERGPERNRIALLSGVLGFRRVAGKSGWRPFFFDFSSAPDKVSAPSR